MTEKLELRMYGLVPYNISPIQQGIQFGHAVVDYGQLAKTLSTEHPNIISQYDDWANNWKTFIILNGGTTNKSLEYTGTLNNHFATLVELLRGGVGVGHEGAPRKVLPTDGYNNPVATYGTTVAYPLK